MEVGAWRGTHFQPGRNRFALCGIQHQSKSQNMKTRDPKTKAIARIDMKTKQLGNSDLYITPIGFGAWAIGGSGWEFGWGEQDDKASVAAIHRALSLGVNWIDTAAVYGMGTPF